MNDHDHTATADGERLAVLADLISSYIEDQMRALALRARDTLIAAADSTDDRDEEDRLLSVMEEVEALVPSVTGHFALEVGRGLDPAALLPPDEDDGERNAGNDHLALVETREVDDWVLLRRILLQQTKETRALEAALWERLAAVAGVPPELDGSPVSLQGLCLHFQAAMQDTGASRDCRTAIYEAFESTVLANLPDLIVDLERALVRNLASPEPEPEPEPEAEAESAPARAPGAQAPEPGDERADAPEATPGDADPDGEPGPGAPAVPAPDHPARVLGAMGAAERGGGAVGPPVDAAALEAFITRAVGTEYVNLHEAGKRTLAAVASLTQGMLEHPEIEDGVKRRLQRLAPSLLVLALQDEEHLRLELEAARYDTVTGLLDQASFGTRLESALEQAGDGRGPALCLLDVDRFSAIGVRLGHQVAGRLLRGLADLLREHAGSTAACARLRADAFAVLLPRVQAGAGRRFAQRLLSTVASARFRLGGEEIDLRLNIGVVEPDSAPRDPRALMQAAEAARAAAQGAGGDCVRLHGPTGRED